MCLCIIIEISFIFYNTFHANKLIWILEIMTIIIVRIKLNNMLKIIIE